MRSQARTDGSSRRTHSLPTRAAYVVTGGSMFRSTTLRAIHVGLTILTVLVWCAPPAAAQAVYGSISGTVTDTSGGALPGVTVTITSVERQTVDTVVTNESGLYVKDRLIPGNYEVKAELASFKVAVVPSVRVGVDAQTP